MLFIEYGNFKVVFSGDMEAAGWREMLRSYPKLRLDLIRVSLEDRTGFEFSSSQSGLARELANLVVA
ncbi:MAG: hypothetical protein WB586_28660 [Chthoniobacterales bacterium]